jgi:hypothetical protein
VVESLPTPLDSGFFGSYWRFSFSMLAAHVSERFHPTTPVEPPHMKLATSRGSTDSRKRRYQPQLTSCSAALGSLPCASMKAPSSPPTSATPWILPPPLTEAFRLIFVVVRSCRCKPIARPKPT